MNNSRAFLTLVAGWLCVLFAVIMLAFCVLMYLLETPLRICLGIGATSLFPIIIAIACLVPSKRSLAIRVIGGLVAVGCIGTLIATTFALPDDAPLRKRGMLVVVAVAGAAMAIKGKWPGAE